MSQLKYNSYKNIFFDLDGTLTDPYEGITNSIIYSLRYYPEIQIPKREMLKSFIGPPLFDSYRRYFGFSEKESAEAVGHYREYYRDRGIFENRLYGGIGGLLSGLKVSGKRVFLATSKPEIFAGQILEHFKIKNYFDGIYGSALDGSLAEKADILSVALLREGCRRDETLMIGDTLYDIEGAERCGIRAIGVTYGYGDSEKLRDSGAEIVDTVEELYGLLI